MYLVRFNSLFIYAFVTNAVQLYKDICAY